MSFLNGHVNALLRKRTNSSRRLQKPRQVRGLPSEAPGGLRLENNPSPLLCADTGSEGLRAAGDRYHAGDEARPLPAPGPSRLGQERGCAGGSISPRAAERALPQPRPRSPHSSAGRPRPPPAHPSGPEQRPGPWKEAGAAAAPSPPPLLGFTWPGSPRCPDLPPPAIRFPGDKGEGALSGALTPHPPSSRQGGRQPLHRSRCLRAWLWRPPS